MTRPRGGEGEDGLAREPEVQSPPDEVDAAATEVDSAAPEVDAAAPEVDGAATAQETDSAPSAELQARIAGLPTEPGVYLFKDDSDAVLYVGKAQSLRARVRSYFTRGGDGRFRMYFLVPRIADVEVVATGTVKEALLLENQLIKKHKPRFNVRLRDDKTYLALRLDPKQEHPRFAETRRFKRDGAVYFGPYTSSQSMRHTLRSLQKIFPLRTCSDGVMKSYARRGRPCLEHSVGRCCAPCVGLVADDAYAELVQGAIRLMRGQADDLLRELDSEMRAAAAEERFERAARLRDRIAAIERTVERQTSVSTQFVDRDVFALAREGRRVEIQSLHVRQGRLMGGIAHSFGEVRLDDAEVLESFLSQYYQEGRELPQEVLLPLEIEGGSALEAIFSEQAERAVKLAVPQRGDRRRLLEMAQRNAELALAERTRRERTDDETLAELQDLLGLPELPETIECYDTSHLRGTLHVGSRVVFRNGRPHKDGYRRYKLREAPAGDDYAALREILERRLARLDEDPAPGLLLLDGGKGQLGAVRALLRDLDIGGIPLASLAKERDPDSPRARVMRHGGTKGERVFLPGVKDPLTPPPDSPAMLLLQRVRDESHRFAIRYHRELRRKMSTRSILDELPGIGPTKRRALLRELGSLERIRAASEDEIAAVSKINRSDAALLADFFRAPIAPEPHADEPPAEEGLAEGVPNGGSGAPDAQPTAGK